MLQSHSLLAAPGLGVLLVALGLQAIHWLEEGPLQVEQVLWQFGPTQIPVASLVRLPSVQVHDPAAKVESALQDRH